MPSPELDIEDASALTPYLRERGKIAADESPLIRCLAGGVSNKTVLVRRESGEAWVLKQALPKLRTQADWYSDPARVRHEALGLQWLSQIAPPGTITPLIFQDDDQDLLAMQAVPEPHENWKAVLLSGRVSLDHVAQFAVLLATIHCRAAQLADELAPVFDDRSFFESLRLEPYYQYSAAQAPRAAAFLHDLIAATRSRRFTLVHGDYSPKNILVHQGRLVLLDHEVIHWGDGGFDLGFALAHFLSKAHHLPEHRARFRQAAVMFWSEYRAASESVPWLNDLEQWAVRHALGCLLARVAGRSPLEYLSTDERSRQREVVLGLMDHPPMTVKALAEGFLERL